jgi:hypothetical protein
MLNIRRCCLSAPFGGCEGPHLQANGVVRGSPTSWRAPGPSAPRSAVGALFRRNDAPVGRCCLLARSRLRGTAALQANGVVRGSEIYDATIAIIAARSTALDVSRKSPPPGLSCARMNFPTAALLRISIFGKGDRYFNAFQAISGFGSTSASWLVQFAVDEVKSKTT